MTREQDEAGRKVWCDACGWASESARDLDWTGAKPTCPDCGAWAEVDR